MAHYEPALSEIAEQLTGTDATLASSLADILAAATSPPTGSQHSSKATVYRSYP